MHNNMESQKIVSLTFIESKKPDILQPLISLFGKMNYILLLKLVNHIPANYKRRRIQFIRYIRIYI